MRQVEVRQPLNSVATQVVFSGSKPNCKTLITSKHTAVDFNGYLSPGPATELCKSLVTMKLVKR